MTPIFEQQCACSDCEAAVSPAAYLAELMDFILKRVRNAKAKIDLRFLVDRLRQPFIDMPTDCGAVEQLVRQVRIAVEVLRNDVGKRPLADAAKEAALSDAESSHAFAAYVMLLNRLGGSYEEVRRLRSADDPARRDAADRLGVDLAGLRPNDTLDRLFLESGAGAVAGHELTEQALEALFGYADTRRDPLSRGAKMGDDKAQITRWNLAGVVWGQNTDGEGRVHVSVSNPAPAVFRVDIHQDEARTTLLATGQIATATGTVRLAPQGDGRLSGEFDIAWTADSAAISISAVPQFLSWQLQHLRTIWSADDHPIDAWRDATVPALPVIDPDLIGPDDFRHPQSKTAPASPDAAFDLWLARRQFVDTTLAGLKTDREAKGIDEILRQVLGNPLPDLDALLSALTTSSSPADLASANAAIAAFGTSAAGFTRLMAVRAKDRTALLDSRVEPVTEPEWLEAYSILTQALKSRQFSAWKAAESSAAIVLGPEDFWPSVTEPAEGDWPFSPPPGQPFIEPDRVKPQDLPDWLTGAQALALRKARQARIAQIPKELAAERQANGFDAMLRLALGHPAPGNPLQHDIDSLNVDLGSTDAKVRAAAEARVTTDLHLTAEAFGRVMTIKAEDGQADPAKKPSAAEWTELFSLLAPARKIKHEYPAWVQQESAAGLVYWKAAKARLPLWRASTELRQAWMQALSLRSRAPIVDPFVIGADDLRHLVPGDPAFDLWKARSQEIAALRDGIQASFVAATDPLKGMDAILLQALGFEFGDLDALDQERRAGHAIQKRLDQLGLDAGGFDYLLRIRALAAAAQPIVAAELDIVLDTLTRVAFGRRAARDLDEERARGVLTSPDRFRIPDVVSTPLPFLDIAVPRWLSTWQSRRDWQDRLQSRIDLERAASTRLNDAIGAVEEATLPVLRDALIEASNAAGATFEERAEQKTAQLLLDLRMTGAQTTTRVAQAIETLQLLAYGLRTGQLKQVTPPPLTLVGDDFDVEWQWIGSYATFRAATFVTLYPENILLPSLVPQKSPAFSAVVADTRSSRVNLAMACAAAERAAGYYRDICSLDIQATCQASTLVNDGVDCDRQMVTAPSMFYLFGLAPGGKVYWSAHDVDGKTSIRRQTFWKAVDPFEQDKPVRVVKIVGAMPYRKTMNTFGGLTTTPSGNVVSSFIHLFCITGEIGKTELSLVRLNLDDFGHWDDSIHPLLPPLPMASLPEIVPVQTQDEFRPPALVFRARNDYRLYLASLNDEGTDWAPHAEHWSGNYFHFDAFAIFTHVQLKAALRANGERLWLVTTNSKKSTLDLRLLELVPASVPLPAGSPNRAFVDAEFIGARPGREAVLGLTMVNGPVISSMTLFWKDAKGTHARRWTNLFDDVNNPEEAGLFDLVAISPHSGSARVGSDMLAYQRMKNGSAAYLYRFAETGNKMTGLSTTRALPRAPSSVAIPLHLDATSPQLRRQQSIDIFAMNFDAGPAVMAYLKEMLYFIPMHLALALQSAGFYTAALDAYRTVYDYDGPLVSPNQRNIYPGLDIDAILPDTPVSEEAEDWLLDPLDPHAIAATRRYAYTRFTIMSAVRCLHDSADADFTQDTGESLARARIQYRTAIALCDLPQLRQSLNGCDALAAELKIEPGKDVPPEVAPAVDALMEDLLHIPMGARKAGKAAQAAKQALSKTTPWATRLNEARAVVREAAAEAAPASRAGQTVQSRTLALQDMHADLLTHPLIDESLQSVARAIASRSA